MVLQGRLRPNGIVEVECAAVQAELPVLPSVAWSLPPSAGKGSSADWAAMRTDTVLMDASAAGDVAVRSADIDVAKALLSLVEVDSVATDLGMCVVAQRCHRLQHALTVLRRRPIREVVEHICPYPGVRVSYHLHHPLPHGLGGS